MFSFNVQPRFGDIDGLGHVNNTVLPMWFETGRTPILKIFDPELTLDKKIFPLIIAHIDLDFLKQIYLRYEVEIKTFISKIGTKSFTVHQQAWQNGMLCVKGDAVLVHFDFMNQVTTPIPEDKRERLREHLTEG
jgi:acyl-CoA thioester hydrolase